MARRTTAAAEPGSEMTIVLRAPKVYVGALVTATLRTERALPGGAPICWQADRGLLHYEDLPEICWRAPAKPGPCTLKVTVDFHGEPATASLEVEVHEPSTEGMVWIPPGKFLCGDVLGTRNPDEIKTVQNANDEPFHEVYLDGYWIDRYPVTNKQFVRFLELARERDLIRISEVAITGEFEGEWVPYYYFTSYEHFLYDFFEVRNARQPYFLHVITWDGENFHIQEGHEKHPVADVTWFGAMAYASWYGKHLPGEAQWEKAARGADDRRYPWGNRLPGPYHAPSGRDLALAPVGSFSPQGDSPYGVCDMLSGCFEWTNEWFNAEYYEDYHGPDAHRNPRGTFWGRSHGIRGFPSALRFDVEALTRPGPVTARYEWIFDHMLGDCFANKQSTFRCAISPERPLGTTTQGTLGRPIPTGEAAARAQRLRAGPACATLPADRS
jgi:formylglycine-generating enzyme required for sulfatase activity